MSLCNNFPKYVAENQLIFYTPSNIAYSYDGNGHRVMKTCWSPGSRLLPEGEQARFRGYLFCLRMKFGCNSVR